MNRNQRKLKAHKARKNREMYWNAQRDPLKLLTKGQVHAKGRAMAREFRDMDFIPGGGTVSVETKPLGNLNSTSTRVVGNKFHAVRILKGWVSRHHD